MINGLKKDISYKDNNVIDGTHPPVIVNGVFKDANGVLTTGLLLDKDANNEYVAYDPVGVAPLNVLRGVLVDDVDTAVNNTAAVLVHGTAVKDIMHVSTVELTDDEVDALHAVGIFVL